MVPGWGVGRPAAGIGVVFTAMLVLAVGAAADAGGRASAFIRPDTVPFPASNPYTAFKAALGRTLFFDPLLSGNDSLSCAGCHDPAHGWEDGRPTALGTDGEVLDRATPTLWDLAWGHLFFLDGRAASLEEQALGPIVSPREMNQDLDELIKELRADDRYPGLFAAAFPDRPEISRETIALALATFERTIVSPETPFDRWVAGDPDAIGEGAARGFALFTGKAGCANCHSGWQFTDHAFHDIGLPSDDPGRGALDGMSGLGAAFKTPTLRDIARRAPYMHDGSLPTLKAVIDHYVDGIVERPTLSPDLPRIELTTAERADLVAFLKTLTPDGPWRFDPATAVIGSAWEETGPIRSVLEVSQIDKHFNPNAVSIAAGATLTVHNDDTRTHNLRIHAPDMKLNSGLQDPGESVEVTFDTAGRFHVFCGIHPEMHLVVNVHE